MFVTQKYFTAKKCRINFLRMSNVLYNYIQWNIFVDPFSFATVCDVQSFGGLTPKTDA